MKVDPYAPPGAEFIGLWTPKTPVSIALALLLWLLLLWSRRLRPARWARLEESFRKLTERKTLCIVAVAVAPLAVRLALLPWSPPFDPSAHDEFGHLLVADTILQGRLANPPHPLRRHFETIYVLQQPAYASEYPVGQGLCLALGSALFGHPWAGVLLAVALMGGAITWALYAVLPPSWAVIGGLLGALHLGLKNWWINSYWGGAFAAFAGALLLGALWRLAERPRPGMAFAAGLGWSLAWLIRPYESTLLFAILLGFLLWRTVARRVERRLWLRCLVAAGIPIGAVFALTLLHNHRVTGSPFVLPYQHAQRHHGVPQSFIFQDPVPMPAGLTPQQRAVYEWQRRRHEQAQAAFARHLLLPAKETAEFYGSVFLLIGLIGLIWLRGYRFLPSALGMLLVALGLSGLFVFFFPHYISPYATLAVFVLTCGLLLLATKLWPRRGIGRALATAAVVGGLLDPVIQIVPVQAITRGVNYSATIRGELERRILTLEGKHVVVVQYTADHGFHQEWVFNRAEIDAAPIIWARYIDQEAIGELTSYYQGRCFWLAEVGGERARLSRLPLPPEWGPTVSCPPGAFEELALDYETVLRRR
jgi:hypothetical protein